MSNNTKNRPPHWREVNGCHNCKYAENPHWGEDMSCGKYNCDCMPYDICDSWEDGE